MSASPRNVAQDPSTPVLAPANGNRTRIAVTTATVYIGGGRRCLSRAAAYRREAMARVAKAYPCDCDGFGRDTGCMGNVCERHGWPVERWARLVRRLATFLRFLDRLDRKQASQ